MRVVLAFAMLAVTAACTFPDVDYADGGSGAAGGSSSSTSTSSGTICAVPTACATDAMSCADFADNKHKGCINPCKTDQVCIKNCDEALQTELGVCAADCDGCAGGACKPNDCESLVGL